MRLRLRAGLRLPGSGARRWADDGSLRPGWDERTLVLAQRVQPGQSVIDVGAGAQILREQLPTGCTYQAVDLVERLPGTVVCDFNRDPWPVLTGDWVIGSGVLEYIDAAPEFMGWLAGCAPNLALSYAVHDGGPTGPRRANGWVNDLDRADLDRMFTAAGLAVVAESTWRRQTLLWLHHLDRLGDDER